ncbi:hypothetical protein, partial [Rudaea cellulosilytica]|uniref:hypothetical protein n=1 Tax=Rudaea cellulosilytica TaxID=540746 RepID=UPI00146D776C
SLKLAADAVSACVMAKAKALIATVLRFTSCMISPLWLCDEAGFPGRLDALAVRRKAPKRLLARKRVCRAGFEVAGGWFPDRHAIGRSGTTTALLRSDALLVVQESELPFRVVPLSHPTDASFVNHVTLH